MSVIEVGLAVIVCRGGRITQGVGPNPWFRVVYFYAWSNKRRRSEKNISRGVDSALAHSISRQGHLLACLPLSSGDTTMRFMVIVKASPESEAGEMPSNELLAAMGAYNEELAKAGVILAAEGLHPSSRGVRVQFSGKQRTVVDGPFMETKELIAGF